MAGFAVRTRDEMARVLAGAVVPLWQLTQLPVTLLWSKRAFDQVTVV
jgi:hypothetical protein